MVLIGFTVFKDKILSGEKRQTIRLPRKRLPKVGEIAHLYWKLRTKECELLKRARVTAVEIKKWKDMANDAQLAVDDGFDGLFGFMEWFARYAPTDDTEFMIIRWGGEGERRG